MPMRIALCLLLLIGRLSAAQPNILFVLADDMRADAAGFASDGAIHTPSLDRLAQRSLRFTRAYAAYALCSPSRAAILSGVYGSANGVVALDAALRQPEATFAHALHYAGYQTAVCGKWHLHTTPAQAGFDWAVTFHGNGPWFGRAVDRQGTTVKPPELVDTYCVGESIRFLRERKRDAPFLLWHCTQLPHMDHRHSWPASAANRARYADQAMPVPTSWRGDDAALPEWITSTRNRTQAQHYGYDRDPSRIQAHVADYRATMSDVDDALLPLWAELDAQGLWDNTIVIFMSDNGWMLGEHGLTSKVLAYEPSARVPLLITLPGDTTARTCDRIVCNLDLFPTILTWAGLPLPDHLHGQALQPLLANSTTPWRDGFVYEGIGGYGDTPLLAAWIGTDAKLIRAWRDGFAGTVRSTECYSLTGAADERSEIDDAAKRAALEHAAAAAFAAHHARMP